MRKLLQFLAGKTDAEEGEPLPFLSPKEAIILRLLIARGESYGLELVDASEGELKRGTIYVTLNRMEEKGYVESRKEANPPGEGPAKRMYRATGLGERVLRAWEGAAQLLARETAR